MSKNRSHFFLLINAFLKNHSKKPNENFATPLLAREWSYEQYFRSVFIIATFATGVTQLKMMKPYQPEDRVVFVPTKECDHPGDSSQLHTPVAQAQLDHRHVADEHNVAKPWEDESLTNALRNDEGNESTQTALHHTNDKGASFPSPKTPGTVTEKRMHVDTTINVLGGTMAYGSDDGQKAIEKNVYPFSRYTVIEQQAGALYLVTKTLQFYSNLLPIWMIAEVFIHLNCRKQYAYVIRRINCWINKKRINQVVGIDQVQPKIREMVFSLEKQKTTFRIGQHLKAVAKTITSTAPPSKMPSYNQASDLSSSVSTAKPVVQSAKSEGHRLESTQNYLFVGPSGTGKSLLAQAIAGSAKVNLFCTTLSELQSSSLTSGSAHLRRLFQQAKVYSPSLIILEHLELIGQVRKETTTHLDIQLFTELLVALTPREKEEKPSTIQWVKSDDKTSYLRNNEPSEGAFGGQAQEDWRNGCNDGTQDTHRKHNTEKHEDNGDTNQIGPHAVGKRKQNKGGFSLKLKHLKPVGYSGISAQPNIVIGTTDNIDKLDRAFIRPGRFNQIIYFTYPNTKDRIRLLQSFTGNTSVTEADGKNAFNTLFTVASPSYSSSKASQLRTQSGLGQSSPFPPTAERRATHEDTKTDGPEDGLLTHAGADERQWYEAQDRCYPHSIDDDEKPSSSDERQTRSPWSTTVNRKHLCDGNEDDALMYYFAKQTQDFTHADLHMVVSESKRQCIKAFLLSHHQLLSLLIYVPQQRKMFHHNSDGSTVSFSSPPVSPTIIDDVKTPMKNRMKRIVHKIAKHNIVAFCFIIMVVMSMSQCINIILKAKNTMGFRAESSPSKQYEGSFLIKHTFITLRHGLRILRQYTR